VTIYDKVIQPLLVSVRHLGERLNKSTFSDSVFNLLTDSEKIQIDANILNEA